MSYRGKKKSNYDQPKRSRFSNPFKRNKNKTSSNPPATPPGLGTTPASPVSMQPSELWLLSPTTLSYNGFKVRLSDDPVQLQTQVPKIVQLAARRKLQIGLVSGDATKLFDVVRLEELENLGAPVTLDPQVAALKGQLELLGWTLIPVSGETDFE